MKMCKNRYEKCIFHLSEIMHYFLQAICKYNTKKKSKEEGGQLEGREEREQVGTGREERRGSYRTAAMEAAAAAGRER